MNIDWFEILKLVAAIVSGLAAAIPLMIQLVKYINIAAQERNWGQLVALVMNLIAEAEEKFDNGADRKEWVLSMVVASAKTINYEVDLDQVAALIDSLCSMSKNVNIPKIGEASK